MGEDIIQKYYVFDKLTFTEIAIKIPRKKDEFFNYKEEAEILRALDNENFYPKVYNFEPLKEINQLELALMGPTLLDLYNFSEGFDKLTIINIFSNLLQKIKYLSDHNIIHHDIKTENVVWGVIKKSEIINPEELYLIDYGLSLNSIKPQKKII